MCELFERNCRALDELIATLPYFTRFELTEKYLEGRDPAEALHFGARGMTIPAYLEELREAKVLGVHAGVYFHRTPGSSHVTPQ